MPSLYSTLNTQGRSLYNLQYVQHTREESMPSTIHSTHRGGVYDSTVHSTLRGGVYAIYSTLNARGGVYAI